MPLRRVMTRSGTLFHTMANLTAKGHFDSDNADCQKHERGRFRHLITHGITQNLKGSGREAGGNKAAAPVKAACPWGSKIDEAPVPTRVRTVGTWANDNPVLGAGDEGHRRNRHDGLEN